MPYATEKNRPKKSVSHDIEVAAILCLAEAERKKKPGLFGGSVAETVAYLSKLYYPIWAVPYERGCLLVDGMNNCRQSILYFKPPDVEAFIEHLKRSSAVQELYHSALRSHHETFSEFLSQTEISINGSITDDKLLSDIANFANSGVKETDGAIESKLLVRPQIPEKDAIEICGNVVRHIQNLESETKGLQFAKTTVHEETKRHVDKLQTEEKHLRQRYKQKISAVKAEVEKAKEKLEKERDEKIQKIVTLHDKEVDSRLVEKRKWDRELLRLEQNQSEYEKRRELRKQKEDKIGEARWNTRLRDAHDKASAAKGKIKALSDFIQRSNKETEKTKRNLHDTYQKVIDEEERRLTELERTRDNELLKKERDIDELQAEKLVIASKIERLIDEKRERTNIIKRARITWKPRTTALLHLPFYLIKYKTGEKQRYRFIPPVITRENIGVLMRIQKKLRSYNLQSKINTLMKPRSKNLQKMLAPLEAKMTETNETKKVIDNIGTSNNLLVLEGFEEKVQKGMDKLEAEGWIKPEEKTTILETYFKGKRNSH
ncbi:MAG: hypothetical protein NWF11_07740 [Candidatus Bathyarchaeota archaeon]|nr:hypothetical protein [Candidatus Bathyarchaeota archaeon]